MAVVMGTRCYERITKGLLAQLQGRDDELGTHGKPPNPYSINSIAGPVWGNGEWAGRFV